jgi:hypothetical protein
MWADESTIKSVKEKQGKSMKNRVDVYDVLWEALGKSVKKTTAVFSFAIYLLPFFSSTPQLLDANYDDIEDYAGCVSKDPCLNTMAAFLRLPEINFTVDDPFQETFNSMAESFETGSTSIGAKNDKGLNNIITALSKWTPNMPPNSRLGESTQMIQKLIDIITIYFGMACWPDTRVCKIGTYLIIDFVQ